MKYTESALAIAAMATVVRGHGFITSPKPRMPGSAMEAACGQQVYYNQEGDNYGNIQGMLQVAASQTDYNAAECNVWMCKGYKYADNTALIESYTAGQVVPFTFDVRAPHTGVANVSIVDTATNTVIGEPLISWDVFASNSVTIPANETSFSITIPSDLGDKCSTAGACIIHHFWNAASVDQTYESCVDFTVGGSSSGSSSAVSSAAATTSSVVSQAAVVATSAISSTSVAASSTSAPASSSTLATSASSFIASSSTCASTLTITTSTASATSPSNSTTTAATATAAVSSALSALSSALPTGALNSTVPVFNGTGAAAGNATGLSKPIPAGFTLKDCLEWIAYLFSKDEETYGSVARRHAKDIKRAMF